MDTALVIIEVTKIVSPLVAVAIAAVLTYWIKGRETKRDVARLERYLDEKSVVGIRLTDTITRGCRIAFELPVDFLEQNAESLEVDHDAVDAASPGTLVGAKTAFSRQQLRTGTPVYEAVSSGRLTPAA